jgi:LacI family transcriptional regulator
MRGDPRIPRGTAARVQAVAKRMGYRPNPRISALMAYIRQGQPVTEGERIAFLWIDAPPGTRPYRVIFEAAKERADQLGYSLEEFWRASPGLSDRRLEQIIHARGIAGLLISPSCLSDPKFKIDWNWNLFSPVVIGTAESEPELHHSAHHHYGGMRLALLRLQAMGKRRIIGLLDKWVEERARRPWSAAFLAYHPMPGRAWEFLDQEDPEDIADLASRIRRRKPDAIVGARSIIEILLGQGWSPSPATPVILLDWVPNPQRFGGVDQCYQVIASNAVDLVAGQLQRNERGNPKDVKMLLSVGRWVAGREESLISSPSARHRP